MMKRMIESLSGYSAAEQIACLESIRATERIAALNDLDLEALLPQDATSASVSLPFGNLHVHSPRAGLVQILLGDQDGGAIDIPKEGLRAGLIQAMAIGIKSAVEMLTMVQQAHESLVASTSRA